MQDIEQRGILSKSLGAGRWSVLNTLFQKVMTLITFFILARLLVPADFGTLSLVLLVPTFLYTFTSPSLSSSVVQSNEDKTRYLNALWTFDILRAVATFILVFLAAPFIAKFFHIDEVIWAIRIGAGLIILRACSNIGQLYFFKNLDFRKIFIRDMVTRNIYSITAITLAYLTHSFWALFIATASLEFSSMIMTYILSPYRPRLTKRLGRLRDLVSFGKWIYAQQLISQIGSTVESTLIGRFTSPTDLGLYGKANSFATIPSPIGDMIVKIGFPAISKIQSDPKKVADGIEKMFDVMLFVILPFMALILMGGDKFVLLILGQNWLPMVPILKVLTVGMAINMALFTLNEPVFNGIGKPYIQSYLLILYTVLFIGGLILLVPHFGALGAAWAILISSAIIAVETTRLLCRMLPIRLRHIGRSLLATGASTALIALVGLPMLAFPFWNNTIGFLILCTGLGFLYLATIAAIYRLGLGGPCETVLMILRSSWQTLRD